MIGVAALVLQQKLHQNARFPHIFLAKMAAGAGNMHADFTAGVAAQHRTSLDERSLCAVTRCGDGSANAGQAAADDNYVKSLLFEGFLIHTCNLPLCYGCLIWIWF